MPPTTRRSARIQSSRSPSQQQQQKTLNFRSTGKVTKPAVVIHQSKGSKTGDAVVTTVTDIPEKEGILQKDELEKVEVEEIKRGKAEEENVTVGKEEQENVTEVKVGEIREVDDEEEEEEEGKTESQIDSQAPHDILLAAETEASEASTDDSPLTTLAEPTITERLLSTPSVPPSLADLPPEIPIQLSKITVAKVSLYHKVILESRLTQPVHQNALSLSEKVLRHFDVSSQYGPCTGITRINRWKRAYRLGLNPSMEVLKVLVDVEQLSGKVEPGKKAVGGEGVSAEAGRKRDERTAFIDEELSSRTAQE